MRLGHQEQAGEVDSGAGKVSPMVVSSPIKNFRQVTPWLYRGGQPDPDGLRYLQDLEIRTVISLRWRSDVIDRERQAVSASGINYISMPLNYWTYPSVHSVDRFLSILDDETQRPVFVHCLHGSDRTGLLIAVYRMARQGWTADQAYAEMKQCGFHQIRMYHFKWAVYHFQRLIARGRCC